MTNVNSMQQDYCKPIVTYLVMLITLIIENHIFKNSLSDKF